jgi:transcriptional regulator with XRE-family HTH domain
MATPPFHSLRGRNRTNRAYGEMLRELRQESGVTQQQLATVLGVTDVFISDVELSQRTPMSSEKSILVCKFFGVDPMPLLLASGKGRGRYDLAIGTTSQEDLDVGAEIARAWYELSTKQIEQVGDYMKRLLSGKRATVTAIEGKKEKGKEAKRKTDPAKKKRGKKAA